MLDGIEGPAQSANTKQHRCIKIRHHWSSDFDSNGSAFGNRWQLIADLPGDEAPGHPSPAPAGQSPLQQVQRPLGDPGPNQPGLSSGYWD
jgi:hypothetical protein